MSIISGICAGAVRPAITAMQDKRTQLYREQTRYCSGYEDTIRKLKLVLCTGNRLVYSAERLAIKEKELADAEVALLREKTPIQEKIAVIEASILTLKGYTAQTIDQIGNFTPPIIEIMQNYLEEI